MEIRDLVSFYIDDTTNLLEVSFRMIEDEEDQIRQDSIDLGDVVEFGYNFLSNDFLTSDEDFEDIDELYSGIDYIDDGEIVSFLNEYYMVYPKRLPKSELF